MDKPKISIVVAAYNYGMYLRQSLDSIVFQTFSDWETIVIDDGSTDNTAEIVKPFLSDRRFRYNRTAHVGQPAAKNQGITAAKGEFVAFLDADDYWAPSKLEKQLKLIQNDPRIGVVYSDRQTIDAVGNEIPNPEIALHRGMVVTQMFLNNFVCFSSSLVRRTVFDDVGKFDESIPLAIDYDLWLRAASMYQFDYVDERLVMYRTGHANLSRRGIERLHIALGIMDRFLAEYDGRKKLTNREIRRAYSETFLHLAQLTIDKSRFKALGYFARAIGSDPFYTVPYCGIITTILPLSFRRRLSELQYRIKQGGL